MKLLIIGATGSFGGAVAKEALQRGHQVRVLVREKGGESSQRRRASLPSGAEVAVGDALVREDVRRAARSMDVIVHGFNVPYPEWDPTILRAADAVADVAEELGLRVVLPGNVYGLGVPSTRQPVAEDHHGAPISKKGRLRNQVEDRFSSATERGAKLLIVRAGDFFGRGAGSSWLAHLAADIDRGKVQRPTRSTALHEWAYLPDLAVVTLDLLERSERLGEKETFHFSGHRLTFDEMLSGLEAAAGRRLTCGNFPWRLLSLLRPFWKMAGELIEMRYLWEEPVLLDDQKLRSFLGQVPLTPLVPALGAALGLEEPTSASQKAA